MNDKEKTEVLAAIEGKDVSEVMELLIKGGNRYSRRILRFFRWFCKWVPVSIMLFHFAGVCDFAQTPREMFVLHRENMTCYVFIYFMLYVLPMVIIFASRFFWLCWKYRVAFAYFFGVNALHIVYGSIFTTNEMVKPHYALMLLVAIFYLYAMADWFLKETRIGKKVFSGRLFKWMRI